MKPFPIDMGTLHGFAPKLDLEKFNLRRNGMDAATEHALRYFAGKMQASIMASGTADDTPWYVRNATNKAELMELMRAAQAGNDWPRVANVAMVLALREELYGAEK